MSSHSNHYTCICSSLCWDNSFMKVAFPVLPEKQSHSLNQSICYYLTCAYPSTAYYHCFTGTVALLSPRLSSLLYPKDFRLQLSSTMSFCHDRYSSWLPTFQRFPLTQYLGASFEPVSLIPSFARYRVFHNANSYSTPLTYQIGTTLSSQIP